MSSNCENCPVYNEAHLKKLGIKMENFDYVIALAGNPNTGKSTVFNSLTGLRQHTGNWPGKTVTRAEGGYEYKGKYYKLVDLPGTYSLLSTSADEEVARNFILFGKPNVTVVVVDATRLERNLNLVLQVLEITQYTVVCLNLIDEAERRGIYVDEKLLSKELGVPVISTVAREKKGIDKLLSAIEEVATGKYKCRPRKLKSLDPKINRAIEGLIEILKDEYPDTPNLRWVAMRLLEGDQSIIDAVNSGELNSLAIKDSMPVNQELIENIT